MQRLQVSRGHVEISRTKRLQTIKSLVSDVHCLDEEGKSKIAEMLSRLNNLPDAGTVGAVEELDRVEERLDALDDSLDSTEFTNEKLSPDKLLDGEMLPLASFPSEVISPVEAQVQAESPPAELLSKELPLPAVLPTQELHSPQTSSQDMPLPTELPSAETAPQVVLTSPPVLPTQELHSPQTSSQDMPLPTELPSAEPAPQVVLTSPPTLSDVMPTEPMIDEILHPVEPPAQEAVDSLQTTPAEVTPPSARLPSKELLLPAEPRTQEALYSPQTPSEVIPPAEPMISEKLPLVELPSPVVLPSPPTLTEVMPPPAEYLTKEIVPPAEHEMLTPLRKEMSSAAEPPTKEVLSAAELQIKEMVPPVEHLEKKMLSAAGYLEKKMFSAAKLPRKEVLPPAEPFMKEMFSLMKELLPLMKEMLPLMRKMFPHAEPQTKEMLPTTEPPTDETLAATESPVKEMLSSVEPLTEDMSILTEPPTKEMPPTAKPPTDETLAATESPVKEMLSSAEPLTEEMSNLTEPPTKEMFPIAEPPTDETLAATKSPEHEPALVPPALQLPQDSIFVSSGKFEPDVPVPSISSVEEMMATLLSSYRDFRSNISNVASFPLSKGKVSSSLDEFSIQEDDDLVLSKTQCELTLEEGRVWDELTLATMPPISPTITEDDAAISDILASSDTTPPVPTGPSEPSPMSTPTPSVTVPSLPDETSTIPSLSTTTTTVKTPTFLPASESYEFGIDQSLLQAAEDRLDALRIKSELVTESYQRRMDPPTKNTYMESRQILEAMGILCYEVEGEDEGEALASSLVLQGFADYVVSEDSVSFVFV